MSSSGYTETSIKVFSFPATKKDWGPWEEKFLAKAKRGGYKKLLTGKPEFIPKSTETLDLDNEDDKEKIKKVDLN